MEKDNLTIYNAHRSVPQTAIKPIKGGRLSGMSDINPMFRIKALTEEFGACGEGWYYEVLKQWLEVCGNETVAFTNIALYYKINGEWSKPVFGTGGSKLVAIERSGAFVSDEAFKMSLTDSLSVACKQLGIGADVYWERDVDKYTDTYSQSDNSSNKSDAQKDAEMKASVNQNLIPQPSAVISAEQLELIKKEMERTGVAEKQILGIAHVDSLDKMAQATAVSIINKLNKTPSKNQKEENNG